MVFLNNLLKSNGIEKKKIDKTKVIVEGYWDHVNESYFDINKYNIPEGIQKIKICYDMNLIAKYDSANGLMKLTNAVNEGLALELPYNNLPFSVLNPKNVITSDYRVFSSAKLNEIGRASCRERV